MRYLIFFLFTMWIFSPSGMASGKEKSGKKNQDSAQINWLTLDELQTAMKKEPKKVYIDLYTNWCGWCKVMDKKTFSNKHVIAFLNQHFYALKLNAEIKDSLRFMGKVYGFSQQHRANELAVELAGGRMSYPTSIFLEENFQNPQPVPGYLDVGNMEMILKYFGGNLHRSQPFPEYQEGFKPSWE